MGHGLVPSLRLLVRERGGAAAIEFALLVVPLFALLFGIIEVSLMFFVDAGLDASVRKVSRSIRTGQVSTAGIPLATFKAQVCGELSLVVMCEDKLLVRVAVVSDLSTISAANPIAPDGSLVISETFTPGKTSDYVLVQAFLPWTAVSFFSLSSARLADGRYLLGSAVLFRNEPF